MLADPAVKASLVDIIKSCASRYDDLFSTAIRLWQSASLAEQIMQAKQDLLHGLVMSLPLDAHACYFCRASGHVHDSCLYYTIAQARDRLFYALNLYYVGETYEGLVTLLPSSIHQALKHLLVAALRACASYYEAAFSRALSFMECADSVEQIMMVKRDLLLELVEYLPLGEDACYFCRLREFVPTVTCNSCLYARVHGNCFEPESHYSAICSAWEALSSTLRLYCIEVYGE